MPRSPACCFRRRWFRRKWRGHEPRVSRRPHTQSIRSSTHGFHSDRRHPGLWDAEFPQKRDSRRCRIPTAGSPHTASERRGNNVKGFKDFCLKSTPESGLDCLVCAVFARQRPANKSIVARGRGTKLSRTGAKRFRFRHIQAREALVCVDTDHQPSIMEQIVFLKCLDLYHTPLESYCRVQGGRCFL